MAGRRRTNTAPAGGSRTRRYTDIEGIAEHLALTVRHVRRMVLERRVPHRKVGSLLRFDIDDIDEVDAWMDSRCGGALGPRCWRTGA